MNSSNIGRRPISPFQSMTASKGRTEKRPLPTRVTENKTDMKKPLAFQNKKGMEARSGTLPIRRLPIKSSLTRSLSRESQVQIKYNGKIKMPICFKASDTPYNRNAIHIFFGNTTRDATRKKIGRKSRCTIDMTVSVQRLKSQKAAAKIPSHSIS